MGGMKLWKRIMFSVVSIIWGFASLDYLYYAFRLMTGKTRSDGSYDLPRDGAAQLAGVALFLLWFLVVWMYFRLIRRNTVQISMIEENPTTGRQRVRYKWFDTLLQIVMIVTGTLLRWSYVVVFVFNR